MPRVRLTLLLMLATTAIGSMAVAGAPNQPKVAAASVHRAVPVDRYGPLRATAAADLSATPQAAAIAGVIADLAAVKPDAAPADYPCPASRDGYIGRCIDFRGMQEGSNAAVLTGGVSECGFFGGDELHCGGASLFAYVVKEAGGWRYVDAIATQNSTAPQVAPDSGPFGNTVFVRTPGDCANVRSEPSMDAAIIDCLADQIRVRLEDGPRYAGGRIWWYISGQVANGPGTIDSPAPQGWIVHELLGSSRLSERAP